MRYLSKSVYQLLAALALAFIAQALATYTYIAGYEPQSDVVQHSRIDLDVDSIINDCQVKTVGILMIAPVTTATTMEQLCQEKQAIRIVCGQLESFQQNRLAFAI